MKTFIRLVLPGLALWIGALAPRAGAADGAEAHPAAPGDPPAGYAELKRMCVGYAEDPLAEESEKAAAKWRKMGAEAQPALRRLFGETGDAHLLQAITVAMLSGEEQKAALDFLISRFPADVDAWGKQWVASVICAVPGEEPERARKLALKELTSHNPEIRKSGLEILQINGEEKDIPALKAEIQRQRGSVSGTREVTAAIDGIRRIAEIRRTGEKIRRERPPGCGRILWLISFNKSGGCPDGPLMERADIRLRQTGEEAMPVWKYLLSRTSDGEEMRVAVAGMLMGHADRQEVLALLKSIIPAEVGDWEKKRWVPQAIGGIASIDPELGRELALKELDLASSSAKWSAAYALASCGLEQDIPRLNEEADRLPDSDPQKQNDNNRAEALEAIAKIKERLAPPQDPEAVYAEIKAAVEDYLRLPEDDYRAKEKAWNRLIGMAGRGMPALRRLFAEREDDASRSILTGLMTYGPRGGKKGGDFLRSQLPGEVADWKSPWIAGLIGSAAYSGDDKLAHELGLKGLGSPSEPVRLAATRLLVDLAHPEDIAVFREMVLKQRGGDPFKALDACGEAALEGVAEIRAAGGFDR